MGRWVKTFLKILGALLATVVITIVLVCVYFSTSLGREQLKETLNKHLQLQELQLSVSQITSFFPLHVKLAKIILLDDLHEPYVTLQNVDANIDVISLLIDKRTRILLDVDQLSYLKKPIFKETPQEEKSKTPQTTLQEDLASIHLPFDMVAYLRIQKVDLYWSALKPSDPTLKNTAHTETAGTTAAKATPPPFGDIIFLEVPKVMIAYRRGENHFALDVRLKTESFGGPLEADLKADGPLNNLRTALRLQTARLKVEGQSFENINLLAVVKGLTAQNPTLQGDLQFSYKGHKGNITIPYLHYGVEKVELKGVSFEGLNSKLSATLTYGFKEKRAKGNLYLKSADLSALKPFVGVPIAGNLLLQATGDMGLDLQGSLDLSLKAQGVSYNDNTLKELLLTAKTSGHVDRPTLSLALGLHQLKAFGFSIQDLNLTSRLNAGQGNLDLNLKGEDNLSFTLKSMISLKEDFQEIIFQTLKASYEKQQLSLVKTGNIKVRSTHVEGTPLHFRYLGFPIELSGRYEQGQLDAKLSTSVDLEVLSKLFLASGDRIKGKISAQVEAKGPLKDLAYFGNVNLRQGYYQNADYNTLLKNIQLKALLNGQRIVLSFLRADDSEKGILKASGSYDLAKEDLDFKATIQNFRATNLDELLVIIKSASLSAKGPRHKLGVRGAITLGKVNFDITKQFLGNIETLNVVNLQTKEAQALKKQKKETSFVDGDLNINITIPPVVNTFGRGLNAMWKGDLKVRQTLTSPLVLGEIDFVKGGMGLLGQTFTFQEGKIGFDRTVVNMPFLDISATTQINDYTITVAVSGRANNPAINLSANPYLPQDEVISYILFGGSTTQLSPLQAIKLAKAVADLGSGGRGFLGATSNFLGFEDLFVSQGGSGSVLGGDKSFGDKVHVHFEQGVRPEDSKVAVDVDLTKNITATTEVGASAESSESIGLKYRYDY